MIIIKSNNIPLRPAIEKMLTDMFIDHPVMKERSYTPIELQQDLEATYGRFYPLPAIEYYCSVNCTLIAPDTYLFTRKEAVI